MSISSEEIIHIMDRAMAKENDFNNNIYTTNTVIQQISTVGLVDSTWHITSHRPFIGKLLILAKRILRKLLSAYIGYLVAQINHINMLQNRAIHSLSQTVEEMFKQLQGVQREQQNKQKQLQDALHAVIQQQNQHQAECRQLQEALHVVVQQQNQQQSEYLCHIHHLEQEKETFQIRMQNAEARIVAAEEMTSRLANYCNDLNNGITEFTDKFTRAEQAGMFAPKSDMDTMFPYVAFENRYRGEEESISDWQSVYLKYFENRENVLDIGCGRGEFLALLKQKHVHAKGIDLSDEMIGRCREQDLVVEKADMFDYLEKLGDGALDGVFCSQVVEHLSTQQLLRLVQLLNKKVRIGAPVVIETINPGNIVSASNGFYMDLSHIRPVHSATLSFLMEVNGFPLQEIHYLHPETDKEVPCLNLPEAAEFNEKMKNVNQVLFGARDYGLVAYRQ